MENKLLNDITESFPYNWKNLLTSASSFLKNESGPLLYYLAALAAMTPMLMANNAYDIIHILGGIFGNVGAGIWANILSKLKDKNLKDQSKILLQKINKDPQAKKLVDRLLKQINVSKLILENTPPEYFHLLQERWNKDVNSVGSQLHISNNILQMQKQKINVEKLVNKIEEPIKIKDVKWSFIKIIQKPIFKPVNDIIGTVSQEGFLQSKKRTLRLLGILVLSSVLLTFGTLILYYWYSDNNSTYVKLSIPQKEWQKGELNLYKGNITLRNSVFSDEKLICEIGLFSEDLDAGFQNRLLNSPKGVKITSYDLFNYVDNIEKKIGVALGNQNPKQLLSILEDIKTLDYSEKDRFYLQEKIIDGLVSLIEYDNNMLTELTQMVFDPYFEGLPTSAKAAIYSTILQEGNQGNKILNRIDNFARNVNSDDNKFLASIASQIQDASDSLREFKNKTIKSAIQSNRPEVLLWFILSLEKKVRELEISCDEDLYMTIIENFREIELSDEDYLKNNQIVNLDELSSKVIDIFERVIQLCSDFDKTRLISNLRFIYADPQQPNFKRLIAASLLGTILKSSHGELSTFISAAIRSNEVFELRLCAEICAKSSYWGAESQALLEKLYVNVSMRTVGYILLSKLHKKYPEAKNMLYSWLDNASLNELINILPILINENFESDNLFRFVFDTDGSVAIVRNKMEADESKRLVPFFLYSISNRSIPLKLFNKSLDSTFYSLSSNNEKILMLASLVLRDIDCTNMEIKRLINKISFSHVLELLKYYLEKNPLIENDYFNLSFEGISFVINLRETIKILRYYDCFAELDKLSESKLGIRIINPNGNIAYNVVLGPPQYNMFTSQLFGTIAKDTLGIVDDLFFVLENKDSKIDEKYEAILALGNIFSSILIEENPHDLLQLFREYSKAKNDNLAKAAIKALEMGFVSFGKKNGEQALISKLHDPQINEVHSYRSAIMFAIFKQLNEKQGLIKDRDNLKRLMQAFRKKTKSIEEFNSILESLGRTRMKRDYI